MTNSITINLNHMPENTSSTLRSNKRYASSCAVVMIMVVVGVVVTEVTTVVQRVIIRFVLHDGISRKIKDPLYRLLDPFMSGLIIAISIPDAYDILSRSHTQHAAAHLIIELVPDDRYDQVLPETVCEALSETQDPFPPRYVQRVFPNGPTNPGVEEKVVRRRSQQ